jgi:hypothetical protein
VTLSRSETILAGVKTILTAGLTGAAAATVYRDRAEALARNEMPAVALDWDSQTDTATTHRTLTTTMPLEVDILINGSPLTLLADPIWVKAHELLMAEATGVPSLPGVIGIVPTGRQAERVSGEIGILRCSYAVQYQTFQLNVDNGLP